MVTVPSSDSVAPTRAGLGLPMVVCLVLTLALRVPFIGRDLGSDESGLLLVARGWEAGGAGLYGDYWVDRPPLLIGYFALADLVPGEWGPRLLGCLAAAVLVLSATMAGHVLRGRNGAWAAGLAASAGSSYLIAGHEVGGMVQGIALVMACCCAVLVTLQRTRTVIGTALGCAIAGAFGVAAVLVKQNLVDGLVFGAVAVVAARSIGALDARRLVAAGAGGLAGALSALLVVLGAAALAGVELNALWYALWEFRADAVRAIAGASTSAPQARFRNTMLVLVASGLALLVVGFVLLLPATLATRKRRPAVLGTVALLVVAAGGIVGGGSWWSHYLLQLVPACCLIAGIGAPGAPGGLRWRRRLIDVGVATVALAAIVACVVGIVITRDPTPEVATARAVAEAADSDDTVFVAYGTAEVVLYSRLESDYPTLWSLPMRVLDPEQRRLERLLSGRQAPTWLVRVEPWSAWGLDDGGTLTALVQERYRSVGSPCGIPILLLRGEERPTPTCRAR